MRFSADQHLAIAQYLRRVAHERSPDDPERQALRSRARSFLAHGKIARDEDWPSCPVGAACTLTRDEARLFIGADRETWRRVYVPYLTATELASLRQGAKETSTYYQKVFAHLRPSDG